MKTYLVGGAVRDRLLGINSRDHDYVVIDTTPAEMQRLGFLKVGSSYDVFLHPKTKDEYVLATDLITDLKRRDLTINAMALDANGILIDPFGGQVDLKAKVLRHTSEHFSDDALRIYRLARFLAQWPDFSMAEETRELARILVKKKSFKELHGNRVFNEVRMALEAKSPESFFNTLKNLDGLYVHFPHICKWDHLHHFPASAIVRFCALVIFMPAEQIISFCENLYVPSIWKLNSKAANLAYPLLEKPLSATDMVEFFYAIDAFRRPELISFLSDIFNKKFERFIKSYEVVKKISVDNTNVTGRQIAIEIKRKRIEKLSEACIFF